MSRQENEDLALILEGDTLELIRIQGIFLVLSIALFSFSDKGKAFSIISLLISLTINILLIVNYYVTRHRIAKLGFTTRTFIEVIAVIMVFVALFTLWILYEVWKSTPPKSLTKIAEEIEDKIEAANKENVRRIEENQKTLEQIHGSVNGKHKLTPQHIRDISSTSQKDDLIHHAGILQLEKQSRSKNQAITAALASVA